MGARMRLSRALPSRPSAPLKLIALTRLSLADNNWTTNDEGLTHVAKIASLTWLDLSWSQVGDATLDHLAKLPTLETLYLRGCSNVTPAGLARLRRARPKLMCDRW